MRIPATNSESTDAIKSKALWSTLILALAFVSWQAMLLFGFTSRMPSTIWSIIDSYALSSLFLEATLALSAALLAGRILSLLVYLFLSSLTYFLMKLAKRYKIRPRFRRTCVLGRIYLGSILRFMRSQKYVIWLFISAYGFSYIFLGDVLPMAIIFIAVSFLLYASVISESRYFPFWKIEERTKEILASYSLDKSIKVLAPAVILCGSGVGFFVGTEKFDSRLSYIEGLQFSAEVEERLRTDGGQQRACFWSIIFQSGSGFLLACHSAFDENRYVSLSFVPNSHLHILQFLGPTISQGN